MSAQAVQLPASMKAARSVTRGVRAVRAMASMARPAAGGFSALTFGKAPVAAQRMVFAAPSPAFSASLRAFAVAAGEGATRDASTTLFVGNLPWSVDDASLKDMFSGVCRHPSVLCAPELTTESPFSGLWRHRRRIAHAAAARNRATLGLPAPHAEPPPLLSAAFQTTDSKVIFDMATGRSKGIAFVNFETQEEANRAASQLNGLVRLLAPSRCLTSRPPSEPSAPPAASAALCAAICAAPARVLPLAALRRSGPTCTPAAQPSQEIDGRNIRVEPRTPPGTERPRREFVPREPRGDRPPRPVRCPADLARPRGRHARFRSSVDAMLSTSSTQRQENDDRKLYVGNLAWAVDHMDLEDIFKEFGEVESAQARYGIPPFACVWRAAASERACLCGC